MAFGPVRSAGSSLRYGSVLLVAGLVLASGLLLVSGVGSATAALGAPARPASSHLGPTTAATSSAPVGFASSTPRALSRISGMSAGSVVRTIFPGYNTSLTGSFTSSVDAWQVGSPVYVPSTDTLWFPQRAVSIPGVPIPAVSPAAVFNLSRGEFDALATNISNTSAFAYDPGNGFVYATEPTIDKVVVFDPRTGATVAPAITVGSDPQAIAVDPSSNNVFVANAGSSNVTVIDAISNRVSIGDVPVGTDPVALVDDPQDGLVFVANAGTSIVSVITAANPSSHMLPISLFDGPGAGLAYSPRTDRLLVTIPSSPYATIIDAVSQAVLSALIPVGRGIVPATTSANGTEFVLGNASGANLVVLNSSVGVSIDPTVPVYTNPIQLVTDPGSGNVFCWTSVARVLESVNLHSNGAKPETPTTSPRLGSIAAGSSVSESYVASQNESLLYGLDSLRLDHASPQITTAGAPLSVVLDSAANRLYVGTNSALEIYNSSTNQLVGTVSGLSGQNSQLVLDRSDNLLWVMNSLSGVSGVNLTTDSVTVSTGLSVASGAATGIAVNPARSTMFILLTSGTVGVVNSRNGHVVLASLNVGTNVTSIVYDAADDQVYAAGDGVSLVNGTTLSVDAGPILIGGPHRLLGAVYEPSREDVFLASVGLLYGSEGTVSVLDGSSVSGSEGSVVSIPVGESPDAFGVIAPGAGAVAGSAMVWVANGGSGTLSVISSPPSITSFVARPPTIDLGFPTSLLVTYLGGAGGSTISYSGLPAGCAGSTGAELNCTPSVTGTFTLRVSVTDSFGFSANATATLVVDASLGVRDTFALPTFPYIDIGVALVGSAVARNGVGPYSYSWSFGDGGTSTGANASHVYLRSGVYVVSVEVRDSTGASNNSSAAAIVDPNPLAGITLAPSNVSDVNLPLSFDGSVVGGTGGARESWSFGDGSTAAGSNATHAWTRPGNFTVTLSAVDELGTIANRSVEVTIHPVVSATFAAANGSASNPASPATPVSFSSNISGGTAPYTVLWSFGDGSSAAGASVRHSYATTGSFSVVVTLADAVGAKVVTNLSVLVTQNASASGGLPALNGGFASGLFLGLVAGGVLAAVVLFGISLRKGSRRPAGPVSPYVPP